jgi:hypothetical protein
MAEIVTRDLLMRLSGYENDIALPCKLLGGILPLLWEPE